MGGRINRGMKTIDSLKKKVKEECNLELYNIHELGFVRMFLNTDSFGHGKGTDTPSIVFFAEGKGDLKLDNLHADPHFITKDEFENIKDSLHPFVRDFMEKAIKFL